MQKSRPGFTLIELLVVIAIIAILAAILFPVFITAKKMSWRANCQSNLKQIVNGALLYADDYNGWTPAPITGYLEWGQTIGPHKIKGWTEAIAPYLKQNYKTAPKKREKKVYVCPSQQFNYSYGIVWWCPDIASNSTGFKIDQVLRPTKMIFFYELRPYYGEAESQVLSNNKDSGLSNDYQPDGPCYYKWPGRQDTNGSLWWLTWPGVHDGFNNLAFVDGHVGAFRDWDSNRMTFYGDKR
ncbi:MAG TPA: prepilin-type N-terminal cleavage/methylation domain-containing protein [Armatimonadota bacterium]|nr:prepilin-type N-terminal cleavage/methylation domain-containing protein [Armatimonadota bacterium]